MKQLKKRGYERRTVAQWEALISAQAHSGLAVRNFCIERGIGYSTFNCWKSRLADGPQPVAGADRFVELSPPAVSVDSCWEVELSLGADVVLRVVRH